MNKVTRVQVILLGCFIALALLVRLDAVVNFESKVLLAVHSYSSDSIDHIMLAINAIGGPKPVGAMAFLFAALVFTKKVPFDVVAVPVAVGLSAVLNVGLRAALLRHRPELWHTIIYDHSFIYSFPSGHACLAASLATAINIAFWNTRFRKVALIVGIVYCIVVAITSITLGVHYPLDILGGWLSGSLIVSLAWTFMQFVRSYASRRLNKVQADEQGS